MRVSRVAGIGFLLFGLWPTGCPAAVTSCQTCETPASMALHFYQKYVSDLRYGNCHFEPSCSQYALEVTRDRGLLVGSALAADRLIRCNGGAHRYYSRAGDGRLIDPPGAGTPVKTRPEIPSWLLPAYDRPPPVEEAHERLERVYADSSREKASMHRTYLEDCAGFAGSLAEAGECERAATEYLRLAYLGQTADLHFWANMKIAGCFYAQGAWERAESEFREAASSGPAPSDRDLARFLAAASSFNTLEYSSCGDLLGRIDLSRLRGEAACDGMDDGLAKLTYERWLFLNGLCLMGLEDWAGAATSFEKVPVACPMSPGRERAVFLAGQARLGSDLPRRSPGAAALFSAVIPGSGQMYSGRFTDGIRHLLFDGLLIYTVYWLAKEENYTGAYLVAGITLPFYVGNIMGARRSAEWFNSSRRNEFIRDSINEAGGPSP